MHDIEAIKAQLQICSLKARLLRLLDTKEWPGYTAMLTEDFVLDIRDGTDIPVIYGRDSALKQVRASVEGVTTVHQAHLPEFELKGDEARVIWAMHSRAFSGPDQPAYTVYGHHHDQWVLLNGEWKLGKLRMTILHLDVQPPSRTGAGNE